MAHTLLDTPTCMEPYLLNNIEQRKRNPFIETSMQDVFNKVKIGTYPLPNNLSWVVVFFIEGMLQKDYDERLGWKELLYI